MYEGELARSFDHSGSAFPSSVSIILRIQAASAFQTHRLHVVVTGFSVEASGGAKATATLYSLIQTARATKVEPYPYLRAVLSSISLITGDFHYSTLLPHRVTLE